MAILAQIGSREIAYVIAHLHWGMSIKPTSQWTGRDRTLARVEQRVLFHISRREFVEACILMANIVQGGVDYPAAMARLSVEVAVVTSLIDVALAVDPGVPLKEDSQCQEPKSEGVVESSGTEPSDSRVESTSESPSSESPVPAAGEQ